MDVRMPDGTIIRNVPDGTSQEEVLETYAAAVQRSRPVVDDSILDARDARAKNPAPTALDIFRARQRDSPVTRLLEGGKWPTMALGQKLAHYASPVIGDSPAKFMDELINSEREDYRKNKVILGRDPDAWDVAGGVGSAANMAAMIPTRSVGAAGPMLPRPILSGAPTLPGRMAQGAGIGAISSSLIPVENSNDFARDNVAQIALSTLLGGLAAPVVEGAVAGGGRALGWLRDLTRQSQPAGRQTASSTTTVSATPTASARGGGSTFGSVGPDDSANLSESQNWLANWWRAQGGRMTPGQQSGSRSLQQMEAKLESQPMTSGPFNTLKDHNQRILNRISARAIGENVDSLNFNVLGRVRDRISNAFRTAADNTRRPLNQDLFIDTVTRLEDEFEGLFPQNFVLADHPLVRRILNLAAEGNATNAQLHEIQSRLGKAALNEMTSQNGNRQIGMALGDVQDLVLDLMGEGLSGTRLAAYNLARQHWRALMQLTGRLNVINPATGNVNGGALAALLQQKDRFGYLFGNNASDLYNAARFAQAFKPIVGDSGTATRSMVTSPTDFVLSLPFSATTRAYLSQPSIGALNTATNISRRGFGVEDMLGPVAPVTPAFGLLGPVMLPQPNERRP